jgi:hypothetical protein
MGLLKKITRPFKKVGKAVRKIIPKEVRPALPFLAAAVPFMLPGAGIASLPFASNPALQRGILSSLANVGSQGVMDPEGDINLLSAAMAGLTGAGTTKGFGDTLRGMRTPVGIEGVDPGLARGVYDNRGFFTKAADLGLTGAAKAADFLGGSRETLEALGSGKMDLFSKAGAKAAARAAAVPVSQGSGDLAYSFATKAMRDFEEAQAEELRQAGLSETEMMLARRDAITSSMLAAAFDQEDIDATLDELGLLNFAEGGIASLKDGGMLDFGGREMDLRGGGFVPIGKKEKADDVPARLSKNEFVMTADAVRAAGGGSVNKGAQRMYNLMNQLEARA